MNSWIIFLLVLAVGGIANIVCLPFAIRLLAERNIIFTIVREGTAVAIMGAGDSGFQRFVSCFRGKTLNQGTWDVRDVNIAPDKTWWQWIVKFFGLSGVHYLGIPGMQSIHRYKFRWNSLLQSEQEGAQNAGGIYFKPHDDWLRYILLQEDVYYARVESAEDEGMVPLNLDITLRVRIVNPYKALFVAQEWLEMTWAIVLPSLRRFISTKSWQELSGNLDQHEQDYTTSIQGDLDRLETTYGVKVEKFHVIRVQPGGTRATMYEEAATKAFEATAEAKKIRILAEAERDRIKAIYGEVKEHGELGRMIRRLEALEKAAGGNSNTIIAAPELVAIASSIMEAGRKRPSKEA
ncbi:MAG: SPFH domain-containing protein [Patescibacteria group bacterium]|jgi:hypothetical protein